MDSCRVTNALAANTDAAEAEAECAERKRLVSVVIPTCNRARLLVRALQSVIAQTYPDLEIIVVDDASSDDTAEVVQRLGDGRIRYLRHDIRRGGSAARNTGIRAAKGAYIAFLDDDDEWLANKVETQLNALGDADAVLCTATMNGRRCGPRGSRRRITSKELRRGRYTGGGTGILLARSEVLRATLFDENLPRCQDWDLFIRLVQRYTVAYIGEPLLKYNEGSHARISNEIVGMSAVELEKRLKILEKHGEFFGARWRQFHRAGFLLYGLRHRSNLWRHLRYVSAQCGTLAVIRAVTVRVYQIFKQRIYA